MKCSRRQDCRAIDYSAITCGFRSGSYTTNQIRLQSLALQIQRFVKGIRGDRKSPVTFGQICGWFSATPQPFVRMGVDAAVDAGYIRACYNALRQNGRNNAEQTIYYEAA